MLHEEYHDLMRKVVTGCIYLRRHRFLEMTLVGGWIHHHHLLYYVAGGEILDSPL
jgi:hypothetical protein